MNSKSDDTVFWLVAAGGGLAFITWILSKWLGLDMKTTLRVLVGLATLVLFIILSVWLGRDHPSVGLRSLWPVFLALAWACFWPALNYWSQPPDAKSALAYSESLFKALDSPKWWAEWYTKYGVFVVILVAGYARGVARMAGLR